MPPYFRLSRFTPPRRCSCRYAAAADAYAVIYAISPRHYAAITIAYAATRRCAYIAIYLLRFIFAILRSLFIDAVCASAGLLMALSSSPPLSCRFHYFASPLRH